MIVVVGSPAWRAAEPAGPAGRACEIALAAAASGAAVELVGRAGDDRAGDELMIALARSGVGHVAVLRDPARPTPVFAGDPAPDLEPSTVTADDTPSAIPVAAGPAPLLDAGDVALGLAYLTAFGVVVVTDDVPAPVPPVACEAAAFAGAHLVLLLVQDAAPPPGLPEGATVLVTPAADPDGAFARVVGEYAAALDRGVAPGEAFEVALGGRWEAPAG